VAFLLRGKGRKYQETFSFSSQSIHSNKLLPEKFLHRAFYKKYQRTLWEGKSKRMNLPHWGNKDSELGRGAGGWTVSTCTYTKQINGSKFLTKPTERAVHWAQTFPVPCILKVKFEYRIPGKKTCIFKNFHVVVEPSSSEEFELIFGFVL